MEKRFIKILLLSLQIIIVNSNSIFPQGMRSSKKQKNNVERFILAPFSSAISKDSVKIVTFMEIPYHSLQFVKRNGSFIAYYQASVGIKEKKGADINQIVWIDSLIVKDYFDTKSRIKNKKHFISLNVLKGRQYEIIGELQDSDTRKKGIKTVNLDFRQLNKSPSLLKPNFLLNLQGSWGFGKDKIPTRGYKVREVGQGLDLMISGYIKRKEFLVNIYLTNKTTNDSLIQKFSGFGDNEYFREEIFIPTTKLNSLKNDFKIELVQGKKIIEKYITFSKYKPGISNYVNDIELALRQMKYILTAQERKEIKLKSKKNKETLFSRLWKKRDPTPLTEYNELMEEYFGRVAYANESFQGWEPGWETDRGMIYILFGPPDEIQRTNPSTTNSMIYQIWNYYKINKQFVFRDQNGFGDYRLDTPFIGAGL